MAEEIVIEIDQVGAAKLTVNGCAGPSCKALTADIERALGSVSKDTPTKEMYEQGKNRVSNKQ